MNSINPATGEVVKTFERLNAAQIEAKVALAAATFPKFRKLTFEQRAAMMSRVADILDKEKQELGRLMTLEMGKTIGSAVAEAEKCAWACRYYAENGAKFLADEEVNTGAKRAYVKYQPLGVVLAVMPWNFPFWQVFRFIAPALMAGNVGLLKHASNVPQCALKIEDIMVRAGFPEGAFQTLLIGAAQVEPLLDDPRIAAATLTGSEGAGVQVGISAARNIKKVVLELGGSDPFIVMPSANFEEAVSWAVKARIVNNGQSCIAAKRFIVHQDIADKFEKAFVEKMKALKVGDPMDPATEVGPLSTADAVTSLQADIDKSVQQGVKVLTGGKPIEGKGNYYPPTVLTNIPKNSVAYSEEFFGPVALLFRVKDADEAIRIANDTRFGLGSSAWTNDPAEQEKFASELDAGLVFINKMVASDPRVPFGGVKASGHGRELGVHGAREFTNIKTVWIEDSK